MNDPGLHEPIADASSEVQRAYGSGSDQGRRGSAGPRGAQGRGSQQTLNHQSPAYSRPEAGADKAEYEVPTRWWYASTGFPLIAGTFGPMASAFSICALVENWRVEVPPGGTEEHGIDIPDPKWLVTVNAISLVCALIANLSLLLNMAKRVSFRIAQPITILGFWISSVLLTILVGYAAHDLHAPGVQVQALSQAYYYGCWAAGLYQLISWMMCVTVYGAVTKRYDSDFNLTIAQRTLMLQTITFLVYLLLGALVFSKIENWNFLNAVYWSDFTLLTVGIGGDMVPTTHVGRGLLFPYSIGGIVALGLVISSIRAMILDRGKRKLHARMTEKMRRRIVKQVEQIYAEGRAKRRKVTGLDGKLVDRLVLDPTNDPDDELDRRRAEFEAMRRVEEMTSRTQKWMNLTGSIFAFAILWFVGAVVFWQTEGHNQGWDYFTSLYFAWTSLLTIGYGDFVPLSNAGRPFFVFWSLLAVPSLTILISDMGDTVVKAIKDVTIWVGEVTILPSDQSSVRERLLHGIYKTFRIHLTWPGRMKDEEEPSSGSSDDHPIFQQPGLVRLFRSPSKSKSRNSESDSTDRAIEEVEESEIQDIQRSYDHHDEVVEDEHHYRHILISEIRRLYDDANRAVPKKYDYDEWAYYLKLLGEDESSGTFHRHAPVKSHEVNGQQHGTNDKQNGQSGASTDDASQKDGIRQWSWIGPRSPLMTRGDRSESEWLVTRLFERLEESIRNVHKEKETAIGQHLPSTSKRKRTFPDHSQPHSPRPQDQSKSTGRASPT